MGFLDGLMGNASKVEEKEVGEPAVNMKVEDALNYIGIASSVAGIVLAIIMLDQSNNYGTSDSVKSTFQIQALIYFISGIVSGTIMIGFSKALHLLKEINKKI